MENLRSKFVSAALGATGGMAGLLSLSGCPGGACSSCFGCAGAGLGVLLMFVYGRKNPDQKEDNNGMA